MEKNKAPQHHKPHAKTSSLVDSSTSSQIDMPTSAILQLQGSVGNQGIQRLLKQGVVTPTQGIQRQNVIQRLPTRSQVTTVVGKPKLRSSKYKRILNGLDKLHSYAGKNRLGKDRDTIVAQLKQLFGFYDEIISACTAYEGGTDVNPTKAKYFMELKIKTMNEKTSAIELLMRYANNPREIPPSLPLLASILAMSDFGSLTGGSVNVDEKKLVGSASGGTNQLGEFKSDSRGKETAFFKAGKEQITPMTLEEETNMLAPFEELTRTNPKAAEALMKEVQARQNEVNIPSDIGIDLNNPQFAKRDVATYRLDQLLGTDLIARTQFALRNVDGKSTLGSMMAKAKGHQLGAVDLSANKEEQSSKSTPSINIEDPNLQRLLSRLQLLDTLAMQADRNLGNFFVQMDKDGNVTGLTGIDNDMSFGERDDVKGRVYTYPGLSKYVDENMAHKIIALDPDLLAMAMSDLLTPQEITGLLSRLGKLQTHLKGLMKEGKLLKPNQWDKLTSEGMMKSMDNYHYIANQKQQHGKAMGERAERKKREKEERKLKEEKEKNRVPEQYENYF